MSKIEAPRGTRDILGDESWKWAYVRRVAQGVVNDFGYKEISLPIFEHTELFHRGVGQTTDVVEKEMYTFLDKGGRSITLRPELTASVMRSYIEHNMARGSQPQKFWCIGPMFRYERPQKGRYRQFVQLDIEAIGSKSPLLDVEIIDLSMEFYRRLGLKNLQVVLNSVGCPECRPLYKKALQDFLAPHLPELCESCQGRFDRNPLRILDCKTPSCKAITENAPSILDHLCPDCRAHFDTVINALEKLGAEIKLDKRLVRGLDYYTKTAFEILSGDLGSQNAVCGGGRYDNLAEAIGGASTPGVGFASGLERVVLTMESQGATFGREPRNRAYIVTADDTAVLEAARTANILRANHIATDMDYMSRSVKAQMKTASGTSDFAVILGQSEIEQHNYTLKNMATGEQETLSLEELIDKLK